MTVQMWNNNTSLQGLTMVMSGGSRGIGLEIAKSFVAAGGNVALLAKTAEPDPRLPGTLPSAVAELNEMREGSALGVIGDVRNPQDVARLVEQANETYGGIDIVVNNASVLNLAPTESLAPRRFELMVGVNVGGTFNLVQGSLESLKSSGHPRILTLAPPLNLSPQWLGAHPGYTLSKYGMSLLTLSWAHELAPSGVAATCLWPETSVATAAVANLRMPTNEAPDEASNIFEHSRSPRIVADAALAILRQDPRVVSGRCFLDTEVLRNVGVDDFASYGGREPIFTDLFVDDEGTGRPHPTIRSVMTS